MRVCISTKPLELNDLFFYSLNNKVLVMLALRKHGEFTDYNYYSVFKYSIIDSTRKIFDPRQYFNDLFKFLNDRGPLDAVYYLDIWDSSLFMGRIAYKGRNPRDNKIIMSYHPGDWRVLDYFGPGTYRMLQIIVEENAIIDMGSLKNATDFNRIGLKNRQLLYLYDKPIIRD